ncbi:hypothetical protein TNCT_399361 [Trichonephila clavata]|uniref:Uncharacterized protein n=1 Tax=Trichonephila clavata TaxID=2740835 RepID=A0A8X6GYN9_TRICU|nr:hypothetical protein TNCT_399361 [Trichonephila clavata]
MSLIVLLKEEVFRGNKERDTKVGMHGHQASKNEPNHFTGKTVPHGPPFRNQEISHLQEKGHMSLAPRILEEEGVKSALVSVRCQCKCDNWAVRKHYALPPSHSR